jgi:hypothetical protein
MLIIIRYDTGMEENSPDYQRGYRDATENAKRQLLEVLRAHSNVTGVGDGEVLSDQKVREIFIGCFGVMAADEVFGPGDDDVIFLKDYQDRDTDEEQDG